MRMGCLRNIPIWRLKRLDSMHSKLLYCNGLNIEAPVAQLDRASVYGTEG